MSDAEFLAPAQSAPFQNVAATYCCHSFSEAVSFCTFAFVRIISKAHGISPEIRVKIEDFNYNTIAFECQLSFNDKGLLQRLFGTTDQIAPQLF
jgi:hypothetical protein